MYSCRYLAGKFLDGHSDTTLTLMTALGLYKDSQALTASNRVQMADRQFKSSKIASYSANVAFILYACRPTQGEAKNTFKVKLLVNEETVKFPGCSDPLCPYAQVRGLYSDLVDNCDLEEVCTGTGETGGASVATVHGLYLLALVLFRIIM